MEKIQTSEDQMNKLMTKHYSKRTTSRMNKNIKNQKDQKKRDLKLFNKTHSSSF